MATLVTISPVYYPFYGPVWFAEWLEDGWDHIQPIFYGFSPGADELIRLADEYTKAAIEPIVYWINARY